MLRASTFSDGDELVRGGAFRDERLDLLGDVEQFGQQDVVAAGTSVGIEDGLCVDGGVFSLFEGR